MSEYDVARAERILTRAAANPRSGPLSERAQQALAKSPFAGGIGGPTAPEPVRDPLSEALEGQRLADRGQLPTSDNVQRTVSGQVPTARSEMYYNEPAGIPELEVEDDVVDDWAEDEHQFAPDVPPRNRVAILRYRAVSGYGNAAQPASSGDYGVVQPVV